VAWLMVAVGGGLGSVLRYGAQRIAANYAGPETVMGTLAVNLAGSFILGFLITLLLVRFPVSTEVRIFLTVGLLGGFTTFSTLSYQTVQLLETNSPIAAIGSLAANVILGLALAYAGILLARAI
jgi:CrcB protein